MSEISRDTRESVEEDYRYLVFDVFIDMALRGEITLEEAIANYKHDMEIE